MSSDTVVAETWSYRTQLADDKRERQSRGLGHAALDLSWDGLSVRGLGGTDDIVYHTDLGSILMPWRAAKQKKEIKRVALQRDDGMAWTKQSEQPAKDQDGLRKGERYILKDFFGVLKPGEMMLVVGRPGSGCSTLLKSLSGLTSAYSGIEGTIRYGDLKAGSKEFQPYSSLVCFSSEEDVHDPNLTVGRTMDFATRNTLVHPRARLSELPDADYRAKTKGHLLSAFGIQHTHDTKVGDQYVRGVSGGERRRVTLAEAMSTDASVYCWDNATRGLDANTALGYVKVCRALCDEQDKVNVVSIYQAGNDIYNLFDKVTVVAEGRLIYYGPRDDARGYFEELGFEHLAGANTADYLTAVTALMERKVKPGFSVPNSAAEFADAYRNSEIAHRMRQELHDHHADTQLAVRTKSALSAKNTAKHSKRGGETVPFFNQLYAALVREYQQRWGDQFVFWARQASTFLLGIMTGSVFYLMPQTTSGLFLRGGAIFSTLIYPVIMSFSDVQIAFQGRQVMAKHKAYTMYRPAAQFIATTLADFPILFFQLTILDVIVYFMGGLRLDAGLFFTFLLFSFIFTVTMTAFFRCCGYAFGNYNDATKITGATFTAFVVYSGFVLYQPSMHPWLSWIRWINPFFYSIEALLSNELDGLIFDCVPRQLAPYGPGYTGGPQACAIAGASPGATTVSGTAYLSVALNYARSHVWRNFGIVLAMFIFFVALGCLIIESIPAAGAAQNITLYKSGSPLPTAREHQEEKTDGPELSSAGTTFTWKDLDYTVKANGNDIQLLNQVSGYCKAGTLTALMGSSGAGKTTLMDVLAARKDDGVIKGEVLLNGHALPLSFQRKTGYCEQLDVHLPTATVREALEFSALLRQPRKYSREEKLAYVDTIIDLLELGDLSNALVGKPGAGLGVEQRKRLTIGVELVSRPSLLFLDEPTSGLDGQSSFMILQFLRKLAARGQSILCTIHQPSAALFAEFDQLLLLKGGGKTVYFGAVDAMTDYFAEHGVDFPHHANPAEYMIEIVSGSDSKRDWGTIWLESKHRVELMQTLDTIKQESGKVEAPEEDGYEYASPFVSQVTIVCERAFVQLWRDVEYVLNKFSLHVLVGLLVGFSYWKIGNTYGDLQNRMFALFNFVFVAPGVMVQTQPKFIANRDIFEKREKKAKLYTWKVFCIAEIVAELPYLVICAFLFWACWYPTAGFDLSAGAAGPVFLTMVFYELLYTGIAQFIAAYAPNPPSAALAIPVVIAVLVTFSGVLIPYDQLTVFWRYWLYYLDPFKYLLGALMSFTLWNVSVTCAPSEYGRFDPPMGQTCDAYMSEFLTYSTGYVENPDATSDCGFCGYSNGRQYLGDLNLGRKIDSWRDMLITLLFCFSSYGLVLLLLKLRSKRSKMAE